MIYRHIQECSSGYRPIKRGRRGAAGDKRGGPSRRLRKEIMGFRQFSLRGLCAVAGE